MRLPSLTYKKKVLLYLRDFVDSDLRDISPPEITQRGIAKAVGMRRTHVSRVVRDLVEEGLLKENRSRVKGRSRKLKTYSLTSRGLKCSNELFEGLKDIDIEVKKDGEIVTLPLPNVEDLVEDGFTLMDTLEMVEEQGRELDLRDEQDRVMMLQGAPTVDVLYGRGKVLEEIDDWLRSKAPLAVLNGRQGFGASHTARRFLDSLEDMDILWIDVQKHELENRLSKFFERLGIDDDLGEGINNNEIFVVIDNYYRVDDHEVDFMIELLDSLEMGSKGKVLVTTREGLPVYERFYHREHLIEGKVVEIGLDALGKEDAKRILGTDIDDDALKRVMLLTKGSPLLLKLLREGEVEEMEEKSALVKEQISLLMFLKEQVK